MKFRPCIDIHNGQVKQIVGSTLRDERTQAQENFVSAQTAAYYAARYHEYGLSGGHIVLLNPAGSPEYAANLAQAYAALETYPQGMQIGGGVTAENAAEFLKRGASHVIVTSYVFRNGEICMENLKKLVSSVGKQRIVLDLSCRRRGNEYAIVTDRWQKFTNLKFCENTLEMLSVYCDEFLVHAVDAEGKQRGIEKPVARVLGDFAGLACTYAGGISSQEDMDLLERLGRGAVDFTVGSALDLFGGTLRFTELAEKYSESKPG